MPAFPSGAGHKNAEDASIKTRGAGEGGGGTNDEAENFVSILAAFKRQMSKDREEYGGLFFSEVRFIS
jgi:hypothetical protein